MSDNRNNTAASVGHGATIENCTIRSGPRGDGIRALGDRCTIRGCTIIGYRVWPHGVLRFVGYLLGYTVAASAVVVATYLALRFGSWMFRL